MTTDDVSEPVRWSGDNLPVAEMSELGACSADSPSSVIGLDRVSSAETSVAQPTYGDNAPVSASGVVESGGTESAVCSRSELSGSSQLDSDVTLAADREDCDTATQAAVNVESVETLGADAAAVRETIDETGCDDVVTESLAPSSEVPVAVPPQPGTVPVGEMMSGDDDPEPGDMQLDIAECVEIGDSAE